MMPETNPPQAEPLLGRTPLREQVETMMNRCVTPALGEAAGQAEAVIQDVSEEMRQQARRLSESVQAQPLTSIALAAVAGFVLARLMGR